MLTHCANTRARPHSSSSRNVAAAQLMHMRQPMQEISSTNTAVSTSWSNSASDCVMRCPGPHHLLRGSPV